jgi:hypothetical protein
MEGLSAVSSFEIEKDLRVLCHTCVLDAVQGLGWARRWGLGQGRNGVLGLVTSEEWRHRRVTLLH